MQALAKQLVVIGNNRTNNVGKANTTDAATDAVTDAVESTLAEVAPKKTRLPHTTSNNASNLGKSGSDAPDVITDHDGFRAWNPTNMAE